MGLNEDVRDDDWQDDDQYDDDLHGDELRENMENEPQNERVAKRLSPRQAVIGATVLFELNVNPQELAEMAEKASLPYGEHEPDGTERLRREWFGFVHAGIIGALMSKAPQQAVTGYLGTTLELLHRFAGYDRATSEDFIDTTLTGYLKLLAAGEQRKCPDRFLCGVVGENYADVLSTDQIAFISGMMAITLCNILDTFERYTFLEGELVQDENAQDENAQDEDE